MTWWANNKNFLCLLQHSSFTSCHPIISKSPVHATWTPHVQSHPHTSHPEFAVQGKRFEVARWLHSMALFLHHDWGAGFPLSNTCPSFRDQFKHTYSERPFQTLLLCLLLPGAHYSLLCAASVTWAPMPEKVPASSKVLLHDKECFVHLPSYLG